MTPNQEHRLRLMAQSSAVSSDIRAALIAIDVLRVKTEAMRIVLSALSAKADVSENDLISLLEKAEAEFDFAS